MIQMIYAYVLFFRVKDNTLLSGNPYQILTVSQASSYSSPLFDIDLWSLID